jgi:ribosomal protein L29
MSDQELMDRLADLTEHLASCRGQNASYEFCKMDIEETQHEIASRMEQRNGRLSEVNGS